MRTVRDAVFDVFRRHGMTRMYANPGSTEVPFLTGLPDDLEFLLGLHESGVVGMATGWAIARRRPALVILHTTAGLGNAVGALATARVNRAPLVVLVGQQDRRHLALEPFLAGRLHGLAGEYPVSVEQPVRAADLPGAVARAWHEAMTWRGPALVIVPMDDWLGEAQDDEPAAAAAAITRPAAVEAEDVADLAGMIADARRPALVVGAGADDTESWDALVTLAERLRCPVWQESFGARAGFPQDHPQYAGILPAGRSKLREVLAAHDLVLAVGAPVFRQYPYEPGPLVPAGTRVAIVTDDPAEAHRSPVDLAVLAAPSTVCRRLADQVPDRTDLPRLQLARTAPPAPPGPGEPLRAAHVLSALAERLPRDAVLVEETPSSRPDLHALVPARAPLGFVSAAMGGLGFGLPAAMGLRMALPDRPVLAVVGDGSSLYGIQALWSAARYRIGVLLVVLANGRYAVMDRLAEAGGGKAPWPAFDDVSVSGLAHALGCPARRIETYAELTSILDDVVPALAERDEPLLLEAVVPPDPHFQP